MEINERIKLIRGSKSQDAFAQEARVSKMTVGRWERGERTPDAEDLNRILKAYPDINPTWLLTGEGEMRRGGVEDDIWAGDLTFREQLLHKITSEIVKLAAPDINERTARNYACVCTHALEILEKGRDAVPPSAYIRKMVKLIKSLWDFWDLEDDLFEKNIELTNKPAVSDLGRVNKLLERIAAMGKSKVDSIEEEERLKILEMIEEAQKNGGMIKLP